MKFLVLILGSALSAGAAINTPTTPATASITVPPSTINGASFSLTARFHGLVNTGTTQHLVSVGGYGFDYGADSFSFQTADTISPTVGNCTPSAAGYTDLTYLLSVDLTAGKIYGQVWNTPTGQTLMRCTFSIVSHPLGSTIAASDITIGGTGDTGYVDYVRWYNSAIPPTSIPHPFVAAPASWLDYKFESGALSTDSSSFAQTLVGSLGTAQAFPPGLSPICDPGSIQTVASGQTMHLSAGAADWGGSYALDGAALASFAWSYAGAGSDGVVQMPSYTTPSARTTDATGLSNFGSFNTQLTVTDSHGTAATCVAHNGVVKITNSAGAIDLTAEGLTPVQQYLVGPQVQFGSSSWPYVDTAVVNELNLQTQALAPGGAYAPFWRTLFPSTHTITLTADGTSNVVGTNTSFKSEFCGGGFAWDGHTNLVWQYTGQDGLTHYSFLRPHVCTDDTHMTIAVPSGPSMTPFVYPTTPYYPWPNCASGCTVRYGSASDQDPTVANWTFTDNPAQYYDVNAAMLINYWRSGSDAFYSGAKTLSTYWMEFPQIDYFYNCNPSTNNLSPGNLTLCFSESRSVSLLGMVLWQQMAGNSYLLRSIEQVGDFYQTYLDLYLPASFGKCALERDNAYEMSFAALAALVETDPTKKASYQLSIKNFLSTLSATIRSGTLSGWNCFGHSGPSTLDNGGYVEVTNGSTTIHGVGTSFTSGMVGLPAWTYPQTTPGTDIPAYCGTCPTEGNVHNGDGIRYVVTAISGQDLTITPPYQGPTCNSGCQRGLVYERVSGVVGWGFQPYMAALFAEALFHMSKAMEGYDAPSQAMYLTYAHTATNQFISSITPDQGGVYNGAYYPGCIPPMYAATATLGQLYCYGGGHNYQGQIWDSTRTYAQNEYVIYTDGLQYRSKQAISNLNHLPTDTDWWTLITLTTGAGENRQLANEGMRMLVYDYQLNNSATAFAAGTLLQNQLYALPGDPRNTLGAYLNGYDLTSAPAGSYVGSLIPGAGSVSTDQYAKWAGQLSGYTEGAVAWPGLIAGQTIPPHVSMSGSFRLSSGARLQ